MENVSQDSGSKRWVVLGWLFLGMAVVGLFLPIVPQVPFAVIAAGCFSKGSPRLHRWIRNHKKLGPPICDWEDHGVIRTKLKVISVVAMVIGATLSWVKFYADSPWMAYTMAAVFLGSILFVLTRPSRPTKDP